MAHRREGMLLGGGEESLLDGLEARAPAAQDLGRLEKFRAFPGDRVEVSRALHVSRPAVMERQQLIVLLDLLLVERFDGGSDPLVEAEGLTKRAMLVYQREEANKAEAEAPQHATHHRLSAWRFGRATRHPG